MQGGQNLKFDFGWSSESGHTFNDGLKSRVILSKSDFLKLVQITNSVPLTGAVFHSGSESVLLFKI